MRKQARQRSAARLAAADEIWRVGHECFRLYAVSGPPVKTHSERYAKDGFRSLFGQDRIALALPAKRRRTPLRLRTGWPKPRLKITQVLEWADEFHRQKGRWPHHFDGRIPGAGEDPWARINDALAQGYRGLHGGSSLARVLFLRRGVRSPRNVPDPNERQIFQWAQVHFRRTRKWPSESSGQIQKAPGETWAAIDLALARGTRSLTGGSSLALFLDARGASAILDGARHLPRNKSSGWRINSSKPMDIGRTANPARSPSCLVRRGR